MMAKHPPLLGLDEDVAAVVDDDANDDCVIVAADADDVGPSCDDEVHWNWSILHGLECHSLNVMFCDGSMHCVTIAVANAMTEMRNRQRRLRAMIATVRPNVLEPYDAARPQNLSVDPTMTIG